MVARKGYKLTEVGEIPEDWEIVQLDDIAKVTSGKRLPSGFSVTKYETPHPYIRVSDMQPGNVSTENIMYVPINAAEHIKQYRIYKGDLFISVAGTLGIVGKIPPELNGANLTENADRITEIRCDKSFLLYILLSPHTQSVIDSIRTVGAQPKLALGRIRKFDIPLPPTEKEQNAIATALSDADTLIDALEQSIAKKRQIKQGAMQELLTGKKRLPGFAGKWRKNQFCELAYPGRNRFTPSIKQTHEFCIELEHIGQGTGILLGYTQTTKMSSLKSIFEIDDILFGKLRAYLRKYWRANRAGVCSTEIWVLKPFVENVTSGYLYQLVQTNLFVESASTAYGTHMPRSDWRVVKDLEVKLPPTLEEQTAIANILSDMDDEIAALEAKLAKARQIKIGMMQELLTGRIRLV